MQIVAKIIILAIGVFFALFSFLLFGKNPIKTEFLSCFLGKLSRIYHGIL